MTYVYKSFRKYLVLFLGMLVFAVSARGQDRIPREYVTGETAVSFIRATPFNVAVDALNEFSVRLEKRVIIDPRDRTSPIGVDIKNMSWRDALVLIAAVNGINLVEKDSYIRLGDGSASGEKFPTARAPSQGADDVKPVSKDLREVTISATFIETDRKLLHELGINWGIFTQDDNTAITAEQTVVSQPSGEDIGVLSVSHTTGNKQIDILVKAMESNDIGDVIANPSITVADGRTGRVQIGQDFSIKQRDFAGNVTDQFVSSGIILTVTPSIIATDTLRFIHLDVQVERSSASPGALSTIINKTQASTQLLLNDGEKAGIGGLTLTEENVTRTGIPLLKNIPKWLFGLGYLFGYDRTSKTEKELVILLKADIVPSLEERLAGIVRR